LNILLYKMFCILEIEDFVRVEPELFNQPIEEAIATQLKNKYTDYIDKEIGFVIDVLDVSKIEDGVIIPEDGGAYHKSVFKLIVYKPELQELIFGEIKEITNFGAFINLGVTDGMIHVSQIMDDYVSFSKSNSLLGKNSKRALKKGDLCLARIVALSYKTKQPKIGLTMRQPGLGKLEWIQEEKRKSLKITKVEREHKESKEKKK